MKKLFALLLVAIMAISLVACGSSTESKGSTDVQDVSADNWTEVLSTNFGLDLSLPDGWSVKSVESPNGISNIKLFLNVGGSTTYADYGETLFNELKKDATGDIQSVLDSTVYSSFSEACSGTIAAFKANVNGEGFATLAINYYDNGDNVEFTFTKY